MPDFRKFGAQPGGAFPDLAVLVRWLNYLMTSWQACYPHQACPTHLTAAAETPRATRAQIAFQVDYPRVICSYPRPVAAAKRTRQTWRGSQVDCSPPAVPLPYVTGEQQPLADLHYLCPCSPAAAIPSLRLPRSPQKIPPWPDPQSRRPPPRFTAASNSRRLPRTELPVCCSHPPLSLSRRCAARAPRRYSPRKASLVDASGAAAAACSPRGCYRYLVHGASQTPWGGG